MGLKTDFKNAVPNENGRRQRIIQNADDTVCIQDATVYAQVGDSVGAAMLNATNTAVNNGAYFPYTHTYANGVHALVGEGKHIEFVATAAFTYGNAITVNGVSVTAKTTDGEPLEDGYWAAGNLVQCVLHGTVLNFKRGGRDERQYDVVCSLSSPPSLTAPGKVYRIWVVTAVPSSYSLIYTQQPWSRTDGTPFQNGDIWIKNSSTIINGLALADNGNKKNSIWYNPQAVYQFINGDFVKTTAYIGVNGEWKSLSYYLVQDGVMVNGTGYHPYIEQSGIPSIVSANGTLTITPTGTERGAISSYQDVTSFSTLSIELVGLSNNGRTATLGASPTAHGVEYYTDPAYLQIPDGSSGTFALDISGVNGAYWVGFSTWLYESWTYYKIKNMWLS